MQNLVTNTNVSVYIDGNDIMFLFKDVTEEQKAELIKLANNICNAGVNTFSTLAPKEVVPVTMPNPEMMQPLMSQKTQPSEKMEEKEPGAEIYSMSKSKLIMYLTKNIDSGEFVGYDNLLRAYRFIEGDDKEDIEANLAKVDARAVFKKYEADIVSLVEANKPEQEFY